jgi:ParB family chromosome partitioning protein
MSKTIAVTSEYRNLPLAQLQESPTNPRRRFDEHSLNELAQSFKSQGVLQPLLVRVIADDKYEVIAGARRLRAAKLAELTDVPVRVVALSDSDCVVAQLIENIQREGVHPMEEALAFDALLRLESPHYDIAAVAQKAGKSPAFVAQRQRLVELIPSIAEAFLADQIGVGHALEIAKLPQAQQEKAFDAAFRTVWNGGKDTRVLLPLRDFTAWIEQNILLSLDSVPFDKADATLVPEAGSCAECPRRKASTPCSSGIWAATMTSAQTRPATTTNSASLLNGRLPRNPNWYRSPPTTEHAVMVLYSRAIATLPCNSQTRRRPKSRSRPTRSRANTWPRQS